MALTDAVLLATHIADVALNYKATVWQGPTTKNTGIVTVITATSMTVGGVAITKSAITAIEAGPY